MSLQSLAEIGRKDLADSLTHSSWRRKKNIHSLISFTGFGRLRNLEPSVFTAAHEELMKRTKSSWEYDIRLYMVQLLWREKPNVGSGSYETALKILKSTERRLRKDLAVAARYRWVIERHLDSG